jgi:hypothetical protein
MSPDPERIKDLYFVAASEYYVAGRFAFWTQMRSIPGNLLHHALEYFMKGHLWLTLGEEVEKFQHNLPGIWQSFKATTGDSRLEHTTFNRVVGNLHEFEPYRYPPHKIEQFFFALALTRAELDAARAADRASGTPPRLGFASEEVHTLVLLLFDVFRRDPEQFLPGTPPHEGRLKYIRQTNSASQEI